MEAEECENLKTMRSISRTMGNVNMILNASRAGLRSIGSILTAKIVIKRENGGMCEGGPFSRTEQAGGEKCEFLKTKRSSSNIVDIIYIGILMAKE